jgi:hypothetical protein
MVEDRKIEDRKIADKAVCDLFAIRKVVVAAKLSLSKPLVIVGAEVTRL